MEDSILRIEDVTVKYGDFLAVDNVSIDVKKGESVAIVGANGAGKTTLMNTIAGLISPVSGNIYLNDSNITQMKAEKRVECGISLVPQGARCFARMTVEDNLLVGCYSKAARGQRDNSLKRVYELFPVLQEKKAVETGSLSGGQRQMVAIGRALMARPGIILFDEMSLGLAPIVIKDIYAAIRDIQKEENTTIVLIEQDTKRAVSMTDNTYVMLKGRVILKGSSSKLNDEEIKKAYFGL